MNFKDKIKDLKPQDLNCNVFDVYSYNGLSMQDLLCQFFHKINECINTSNKTIDLAQWLVNEGLSIEVVNKLMLWLEDGTLENIINVNLFNSLNTKIDNFSSQLEHIMNYNITNEFDFNVNDISTTVNRIIPKLKSGDTLLIPRGNYYFKETLNFTKLQEGVKIVIDGVLNHKGNFSPSIVLSGHGFDFTLYKLIGGTPSYGTGVLIGGGDLCFESYITIKRIENFDVGIELNPRSNKGNKGVQYNTLKGKLIVNCNKCIYLNLENPLDGWINENTFYDFRLIGEIGVTSNNVTCYDNMGYNNNKFYNIGFEQLTGDAVDLKYCIGTSFINCRMLEDIEGTYIKTNETCYSNLFIFSHPIWESRISLNGIHDRIIGTILNGDGTIISNGFTLSANRKKIHDISNETCVITSNDATVRKHDKSIFINSANNPIIITLPLEFNREGFRVVVKVADFSNNITFKDYKGNIVIDNKINSTGCWEIIFINEVWDCYKLDYNVGQLPAQYTDANTLEEISQQFKLLLENMRESGLMKY